MAKKLVKNQNPIVTVEVNPNLSVAEFHGFEVRRKSQFVWSVGDKGDSTVTLTGIGQIRGFVNALQDFVDKRYKVLEYGLHMTINPEDAIHLYQKDDVGHVNFDLATHPCIEGLQPSADYPLYWHVLNVRNGRLKTGKPVVGMLKDEFDAHVAGMNEQQLAYANKRNGEMWGRYFKQKGLELAMRVAENHIKVVCALEPKAEGEIKILEKKFRQLGMTDEARIAERKEDAINARSRQTNNILAASIATKPEVKEVAKDAASTVMVLHKGETLAVKPKELVGKTVRNLRGEVYLGGSVYMRAIQNVLAQCMLAHKQGAVIEVQ